MAGYSYATIVGNATSDPEIRQVGNSGTSVLSVSIAVNRKITKNGQRVDEVSYFDVTVWSKLAEVCSQYLRKGQLVLFSGELVQDRWTDSDGKQRSKVKLVAEKMQFLSGSKGGSHEDSGSSQTHEGASRPRATTNARRDVEYDDVTPF